MKFNNFPKELQIQCSLFLTPDEVGTLPILSSNMYDTMEIGIPVFVRSFLKDHGYTVFEYGNFFSIQNAGVCASFSSNVKTLHYLDWLNQVLVLKTKEQQISNGESQ